MDNGIPYILEQRLGEAKNAKQSESRRLTSTWSSPAWVFQIVYRIFAPRPKEQEPHSASMLVNWYRPHVKKAESREYMRVPRNEIR